MPITFTLRYTCSLKNIRHGVIILQGMWHWTLEERHNVETFVVSAHRARASSLRAGCGALISFRDYLFSAEHFIGSKWISLGHGLGRLERRIGNVMGTNCKSLQLYRWT